MSLLGSDIDEQSPHSHPESDPSAETLAERPACVLAVGPVPPCQNTATAENDAPREPRQARDTAGRFGVGNQEARKSGVRSFQQRGDAARV